MIIKVKLGDRTLELNSKDVPIAVLLTPKDKEVLENMEKHDMLYLAAPLKEMMGNEAALWKWAFEDWQGAKYVNTDTATKLRSV